MKKLNKKVAKKILAILTAGVLTTSYFGCSNISTASGDNDYLYSEYGTLFGRVALSLPTNRAGQEIEISKISLTGKKEGSSTVTTFGTWESSSELKAESVSVPVGKWTFTLSAIYDGDSFSGSTTAEIKVNTTTELSFGLTRNGGVIKGTLNEDGSYTIINWNAADYAPFTNSTDTTKINSTFDDVAADSCTEKNTSTFLQLSAKTSSGATQGSIKFIVPANTSKIVISAKNGSTTKGAPTMTVASATDGDWSVNQAVTGSQADYTFTPAFKVTANDEGVEFKKKTIVITNTGANGVGSLNVYSIKVYAPTQWTVSENEAAPSSKDTDTGSKYQTPEIIVDAKIENTANTETQGSLVIQKAEGWINSAYVIFNEVSGATYSVTCDGVKVDDELIRHYNTYNYNTNSYKDGQTTWTKATYSNVVRVDVLGLKAGSHKIVITPSTGSAATVNVTVFDDDRTGFAFTSNETPGAYKMDGSLKDNADVLYVTNENFNTIQYTMKTNNKGGTETLTGVQAIVGQKFDKYYQYNNKPLAIRIIGTIDATTGFPSGSWGSSAEGLEVKWAKATNVAPLTIEGVGNDAGISGFGILTRNTNHVEIKNLAVMNCADDSISVDTANTYLWIHNCDFYYGGTGGDKDQAKGDGTTDLKGGSTFCTVSYNHYNDNGKSCLFGMDSQEDSYNTLHHNWFDHSDSRHPRIRAMSVHIYNNYFDGNSKYGVGVTNGGSAFVEGNMFRDAHDPMMSSKQGTDATGEGTFSGEPGGWIKAYNNKFIECNAYQKFQFVTNKDVAEGDCDIDAYVVDNRSDTVPSNYKTILGGNTYNNFDTIKNLGVSASQIDDPDTAKAKVLALSGRHNPDFAWTFDNATEDKNYSVISALKSAIVNHRANVTKVGN